MKLQKLGICEVIESATHIGPVGDICGPLSKSEQQLVCPRTGDIGPIGSSASEGIHSYDNCLHL